MPEMINHSSLYLTLPIKVMSLLATGSTPGEVGEHCTQEW